MWLPINERYELNVSGAVRNRKTQLILTPWVIGQKPKYYRAVWIDKVRCRIHHLVAKKFLPAPTEEKCVVDHIDRNRQNNHASNLRWVNHSVNATNKTIVTKTSLGENHHIRTVKCDSNTDYVVRITINKITYCKTFSTLEDARAYRDDIINNSEFKEILVI